MFRSLLVLLLMVPALASAFIAVETDQSEPYEIVPVEAPLGEARYFLGELTGYPIMYEVSADEPFTFSATVRQLANKEPQAFAMLLVRKNDRGGGVSEVARMNVNPKDWQRERDGLIGLSFAESPSITAAVEPGTYRLEVSTPQNNGTFMLQIGEHPTDTGYLEQLQAVRTTQQFFGYSILAMLGSQLVFYPLGIVLLLFAIYKTWQYRHTFKPVQSHGSTT